MKTGEFDTLALGGSGVKPEDQQTGTIAGETVPFDARLDRIARPRIKAS